MTSTATRVLVACAVLLCATASAQAEPATHDAFSDVEIVGPETITDLPCFEGRAFTISGTVATAWRITQQTTGLGFHFAETETFDMTIVPNDGVGPTYVEHGVERTSFNADEHNTVFNLTIPFHDTFVAYDAAGRRVPGQTIRIQGVTRMLVEDKDAIPGSGARVKVDFQRERLDCA